MRKILKWSGMSAVMAGVGLGVYLIAIQAAGNFAVVVPGELYRSNQPRPDQIAQYAAQYGIRTIINLRGSDQNAAWYRDEITAARTLGLKHIDFQMSATRQLDAAQSSQLIAILRDAPRPILIHCRSGADRTGLASVIYLNRIAKVSEDEAEKQLSIRYGHVGIPYLSPTYAMEETWETMEDAARRAG